MKNIVFIISGMIYSGAEIVLKEFLSKQKKYNVKIFVLGNDATAIKEFSEIVGPEKIFVAGMPLPFSRLDRLIFMGCRVIKYKKKMVTMPAFKAAFSERCDAVVLNNTLETIFFAGIDVGVPKIAHIHDMVQTFKPAMKRQTKLSLGSVQTIIAVSIAVKKQLTGIGVAPSKIDVVYNSIEISPSRKVQEPLFYWPVEKKAA